MALEIITGKLLALIDLLQKLSSENTDRRIGEMLQTTITQTTPLVIMALQAAKEEGKLAIRCEAQEQENMRLKQRLLEAEALVAKLEPENAELKGKLKRQQLKFVPEGGYYTDPENEHAVCTRCLTENNIIHMLRAGENFMCMACNRGYPVCYSRNKKA